MTNEINNSDTSCIVELVLDPESGDLVLPIPDHLWTILGWEIGDTLTWKVDPETHQLSITNKTNASPEQNP